MVRAPPKEFQILVKTHKTTIFLTLPNTTFIAEVKKEVLSALKDYVAQPIDMPHPDSVDDFVLCTRKAQGQEYETLDDEARLIEVSRNWDRLYIQFRDDDGEPLPVNVTLPNLDDEEEEEMAVDAPVESEVKRGKRKAPS